ncbi:MAG TPA: hypothetical protein ENN09_04440 [Planctomycetes bacterium]|nr:hypothetical protein [Planctomycetota bacterium]
MTKKSDDPAMMLEVLLRTNPSFGVLLEDGKTWLCPYCGTPAVADRGAKNFNAIALNHLLKKCPKSKGLAGIAMQTEQLKHISALHQLKQRFASEAAWRISTGEGVWLCPYCTEATDVSVSSNGVRRPLDDIVRDIHNHLVKCYTYTQEPGTWRSVEDIKNALAERKQQENLVAQVAALMNTDPVFQFSDRYGHWICPFCEKPMVSVDFSSPFARTHAAPQQALAHFQGGSCAYKGGPLDPGKTVEHMKAVASRHVDDAGLAEQQAEPSAGDTQYLTALKSELSELRSHIEQNKELRENLMRARKAQQQMLPTAPPAIDGFEMEVFFRPSEEVSGDFYDFIKLADGRIGIVIGDVSGHGIDAGMVMGMTKKAFSLRAQEGRDAVATVSRVNEDIIPELGATTFVTATYGILNPGDASFSFARCGHTFPVLCKPEIDGADEVLSHGIVLGSVQSSIFANKVQPASIRLNPGHSVSLFTDGVLEAMRESGEEFGKDRLLAAARRHMFSPALGILEGIIGAVGIFAQNHKQEDDMTIIVIRRNP